MTTVDRWTGCEAKLLRAALRLSVRDFAARLGVGLRTVNKWEARQADITPLPHMQEVLDTALAWASDEVKARFAVATRPDVPEHETAQVPEVPLRGAMLPVVVNGRLVFVPFDVDTVAGSGLSAVMGELAATGAAGDSAFAAGEEAQKRGITAAASSELWQTVTAITVGMGQADLDLDRLDRLIPRLDADEPPRQVGAADIDAIERTSDALRRRDFAHGGGLTRAAAIAQLRSVLRLRRVAATPAIRMRLDIAAADAAMLAAWSSYDVEQHDDARRLWIVALELCRHTDHPRAADLAVLTLLDMAHQSLHLMRPDDALRFAGLGLAVENGAPGAVSDATRSYLASVQSWSYATLGETTACERAVGRAEAHCAAVDPGTALPWTAYIGTAEFTAQRGHAWYLLSATQPDAAARAVPLLTAATSALGSDYARTRAVNLAGVAGSHARTGDTDAAVSVGRHALEEISRTSSRRAYQRLRMLDDCLAVHQTADVADLRHDIQTACAAS
ncbi:MAG: XRE family transcriptional regulator [Actinomycetota bacterium]|nr:XRE family transcriptional regulator [Actinomycetota bacterium]